MCERKGDDADLTLRTPSGLPEVFRENDSDGSVPETPSASVRHLPCQDPEAEAERSPQRIPFVLECARTFLFQQVLDPALSLQLLHDRTGAQFRVPLLNDLGIFNLIRFVQFGYYFI
jgi:hypothetical protein